MEWRKAELKQNPSVEAFYYSPCNGKKQKLTPCFITLSTQNGSLCTQDMIHSHVLIIGGKKIVIY